MVGGNPGCSGADVVMDGVAILDGVEILDVVAVIAGVEILDGVDGGCSGRTGFGVPGTLKTPDSLDLRLTTGS